MKSQGKQGKFAIRGDREMNHRFKNLNGPARSLIPEPRNQRFVETLSHSAVIEERNRFAREIHDTLVQEFAGILLHLEAEQNSRELLNQRSEEHTSELQSHLNLVCRLLLEKKKTLYHRVY